MSTRAAGQPGKPSRPRRAGIKDVAGLAGVSATTVSQVLNEVAGVRVSEETRERIHEAAKALGYAPNRLARGLRTQRSGTLGLVSDNIATTPYAGRIVVGAQEAALRHGCTLLLVNTDGDHEREQREIEALVEHQVDGILYARMYHQQVVAPEVLGEFPTVLLDASSPTQPQLPAVVPDEVGGGRVATEELLQHGHRRIGFTTNVDDVPATRGRLQGYREALAAHGVEYDPALVVTEESVTKGGYRAARELLTRDDRPTALFCFNDRMAMGAYRAAAELGLSVPGDLSIVGFDNQELISEGLYPELTTVALPHYEMGVWAVEALMAVLAGSPPPDPADPSPVLLPCPLVRRASVAPPA